MENELISNIEIPITFQLFTPGSDIAIGFRPDQFVWGRTGKDFVIGYQAAFEDAKPQTDILVGDLAIEDPKSREWQDIFVLGDWVKPYYSAPFIPNNSLSTLDTAVVIDFDPEQDLLQLYGEAKDYQLLEIFSGTAILLTKDNQLNLVAYLPTASNLTLNETYFQFRGTTPPALELSNVQQFGTTAYDIPLSIATDASQNVYVAGGTNGSLIENSLGLRDNFVIKYDSRGNQLFSTQFGTSEFDTIYGIDTDNQGNFYVTGVTAGDLAGPKRSQDLDTFVAKYDSEGNQEWIRQIGQNVLFNAFNLAVNKESGDVFISGADLKETNEDDTFVIKYDTDGEQQWFVEVGTTGLLSFDESYGLNVAPDGSLYAGGWTAGDLDPSDEAGNAGLYDNWLAKFAPETGEVEWIRQYGTPDYEWLWDVRTDSLGFVYTTGWTLGDLAGSNQGEYDAYLTKFDSLGNMLWKEQFGTAGDDEAYSLFIDDADKIFIGGYTDGDFQGENAGSFDAWVARYSTSGVQDWVTQFGTSDRDELYGLTGDTEGNLYATGITQGSMSVLNAGSFDGWTAKLSGDSGDLLDFSGGNTLETALETPNNEPTSEPINEPTLPAPSEDNSLSDNIIGDLLNGYLSEYDTLLEAGKNFIEESGLDQRSPDRSPDGALVATLLGGSTVNDFITSITQGLVDSATDLQSTLDLTGLIESLGISQTNSQGTINDETLAVAQSFVESLSDFGTLS